MKKIIKMEVLPLIRQHMYTPMGSGLITAPTEIINSIFEEVLHDHESQVFSFRSRKQPHPFIEFSNGFRVYFRPIGHDGSDLRGIRADTFAVIFCEPAATRVLTEFYRAAGPGCEINKFDL
jgi:hypothetical protein